METQKTNSNVGLIYGLIAGLGICVITLLQYMGGVRTYLSPLSYLVYVILIIVAVLAGQKHKRLNGGYQEYSEALKVTFSVFASALLLQTLLAYILFNFIDPQFKQALNQEVMNRTEDFLRNFGASDSQIDAALEKAGEKDSFSFGNTVLGYGLWCIIWFLVCLIISAIIKKRKPIFPTNQP